MQGANKYAKLFTTGQYGKLYITSGSHARGYTFRIQILPEGEEAIPNGSQNMCLNKNAVEVYGVTSGNPGWTETYGWLHTGKWVEDFERLVAERESALREEETENLSQQIASETEAAIRVKQLLEAY
jgi:uncharacterized protein CbrC (UPF0167 family)